VNEAELEIGAVGTRSNGCRCGYVALAGRPNVGKSTLLNALIGEHLSIVSPKAQTTRERVSGILTTERFQIVFIDAPGLIEPRYALQEAMRWAAETALDEADVVAFIADATRPETLPDESLVDALRSRSVPLVVAINKCDLIDDETQDRLLQRAGEIAGGALAISAVTGAGLDDLLDRLVPLLPESPPLYPLDDTATQPVRFFVQEFVRETCMELFRDEIPYSITCRVDEFREDQDPIFVRVMVYVERESQKGIVIGKGGSALKRVGEISRKKIEGFLGRHVYLELRVKVMPRWSRDRARLKQLGFRLPAGARTGQKRR
jgi:GTP-binding protein Era